MSSIYNEYGIPPEEGEAMMKLISYITIENPKIGKEASYIPSELSNDISHFDIIWTTSMEKSYAKRRDWDEIMALREFIQNSLDAEHEKFGYDNINIKIENTPTGLIIEDRGNGINYKAFALGGEDKKCYLRGAYGEGLKVAALYMSMKGKDVYVFSGDIVYKCYISKITHMLTIAIGKSTTRIAGTKVLINKFHIDQAKIDNIIYHPDDPHIDNKSTTYYFYRGCEQDMPNTVMQLSPTRRNKLYVRDMFVNYTDKIIGKTFYSYNLWWVDLEPNRTNVSRISQLSSAIEYTLTELDDPAFIKNLIESNLDHIAHPHQYYRVNDNDLFELKECYFTSSDTTKRAIDDIMHKYHIDAWTTSKDPRDIIEANHEGITPIVIPYGLNLLFKHIQNVTNLIIETSRNLSELDQIPRDQLTVSQLCTLNEWQRLAKYVSSHMSMFGNASVKIVVVSGDRSFYTPISNTISISIDKLENKKYTTFIHELSHAVDYARTSSTNDLTENFEYALAKVGSDLVHIITDKEVAAFKSRCSNYCFNARPQTINNMLNTVPQEHTPSLLALYKSPCAIRVSLYEKGRVTHYPIGYICNIIDPCSLPDEAQRTYDTNIDKAAELIINLMKGVINDKDLYYSIKSGNGILDLTDLISQIDKDMCYEQILNMLSHVHNVEKGKAVSIYKYSLVNDEYILFDRWLHD